MVSKDESFFTCVVWIEWKSENIPKNLLATGFFTRVKEPQHRTDYEMFLSTQFPIDELHWYVVFGVPRHQFHLPQTTVTRFLPKPVAEFYPAKPHSQPVVWVTSPCDCPTRSTLRHVIEVGLCLIAAWFVLSINICLSFTLYIVTHCLYWSIKVLQSSLVVKRIIIIIIAIISDWNQIHLTLRLLNSVQLAYYKWDLQNSSYNYNNRTESCICYYINLQIGPYTFEKKSK